MSNSVSFNGVDKTIEVLSGITSIDVQIELYSEWKRWAIQDNNLKYLQAFRTFGGDPTISGQFAPRYYFLTNGWRVLVNFDEVNIGVNLYTDELDSPVIVSSGASASIRNSDAVNVERELSKNLDYAGSVIINSLIGVSGSTYPIGTTFQPVNNISDALVIAAENKIHELHIFGSVDFNVNFNDSYEIYGGNIRDIVNLENINTSGSTFRQCVIQGSWNGEIVGDNCILRGSITGDSGFFQHCGIDGDISINNNNSLTFVDCFSQIPGNNSPKMYLGNDIGLNIRRYSGGMAFYDIKSGTSITIEYVAGNCRILSGCTGGEIEIRGIAKITDQSSGTTIGTDGLLIPYQIAQQHTLNVNTEIIKNK